MTDNEIVKALECCDGSFDRCGECPLDNVNQEKLRCWELEKSALDLINRLQAENETLRDVVKQNHLIRNNGKSPLSLIKAEAYKEFAEKSEKEIFIKQDNERKQMLEILKTYRGTRTYSDTERATDNWLRGYGEAVQDILSINDNLLKKLAGGKE